MKMMLHNGNVQHIEKLEKSCKAIKLNNSSTGTSPSSSASSISSTISISSSVSHSSSGSGSSGSGTTNGPNAVPHCTSSLSVSINNCHNSNHHAQQNGPSSPTPPSSSPPPTPAGPLVFGKTRHTRSSHALGGARHTHISGDRIGGPLTGGKTGRLPFLISKGSVAERILMFERTPEKNQLTPPSSPLPSLYNPTSPFGVTPTTQRGERLQQGDARLFTSQFNDDKMAGGTQLTAVNNVTPLISNGVDGGQQSTAGRPKPLVLHNAWGKTSGLATNDIKLQKEVSHD